MLRVKFLRIPNRRLLATCSAAAASLLAPPVFAQEAQASPSQESTQTTPPRPGGGPGLIILSRDVGPRNALSPEVGQAHTVRVAPEPSLLAFPNPLEALSDEQAGQVSSGFAALPSMHSILRAPLESLSGNDNIRAEGAAGAGGVGNMVGSAIGQGMSALTGALGGLPGLNQ